MTECKDNHCPFHAGLKVRGKIFTGTVISAKAPKTIVIEREMAVKVPKFERIMKVKSKIAAHNPDCIKAVEGDIVTIGECRKISKRKSFVVIKKEGHAKVIVKGEEKTVKKAKKEESEEK